MRLYAGPERSSEEITSLLFVESLEVSSINGKHIPSIPRIVRSGERRFDLLPGDYEVVVHYDVVWPLNASDDEVVRSESWRLRVELEAGHTYRVEHRPAIDLDDARLLIRDLKLIVVDLSSGRPVQIAVESRPAEVSTPLVVSPVPTMEGNVAAAALLKFWWQRASPEERAQFRGWIEE